jgi:hypothetical protein
MSDLVTLRSYRLAFELERRLHRIDRFRIPVPYGVPLRGIAYAVGVLVAILWSRAVPLVGDAESIVPWPVRVMAAPVAAAVALCRLEYDGRPVHEAAAARLVHAIGPSSVVAFERMTGTSSATLDDVLVAPDERGPSYRPGRIAGEGPVVLRLPVRARRRGREIEIQLASDRPMFEAPVVELGAEDRIVVR